MRQTFDSLSLACVVDELQVLVGAQVQRIIQPHPLQIILTSFKTGVGEKHLLLDASPQWYRSHLTKTRAPNPPSPPAFCAALRKYLSGGKLLSITQRDSDRILDLTIENQGEKFLLSAELMGKHANIILVSPDGKILHAAKLISSKQSRVREVLPGREYSAPPAPAVRKEVHTIEWQPVVLGNEDDQLVGAYPILRKNFRSEPRSNFNAALDEYFSVAVPLAASQQQARTLRGAIDKSLRQKRLALQQVQRGTSESTRAEQYRRWGELLLAHLQEVNRQMKNGASEVEVVNFYDEAGAAVKIPIDEELSPQENANRFFARARHLEENAAALRELESRLACEVEELNEYLAQLESSATPAEMERIRQAAEQKGWLRGVSEQAHGDASRKESAFAGYKIKRFTSPDGFEVLVGENATANDYLVTRLSHSNDWWLHLRGGTSSHAVIKTNNAPDRVPLSTLLFAAKNVIARSVAKHAGWAEVDYTLRKYVRKPRKAAPGAVLHTNAKTLHVDNNDK